ncbi:MAG: LacI family DNA-binding transcriptional regulator [Oscillospiraceae bacterium]|jgi:LacI family transcriptional regulator|nr:LacI family DNA-binding transcriptional regulator [Oscillospiraceae bacterium]
MTVRDIARIAGVSPSTVSIVLNNRAGVSDQTRKRVLELLDEYGYSSNRRGATVAKINGNICFLKYNDSGLIPEKNDNFISEIIDTVEVESRKLGYNLILTTVTSDTLEDTLKLVRSSQTMGVIFLGTCLHEKESRLLTNLNVPLVVIDNYLPSFNMNCVVMNNAEIVRQAVNYLYKIGHRKIGYVRSKVRINNFNERFAGFLGALDSHKLELIPDHLFSVLPGVSDSYEDMKAILDTHPELPGALVCDNDAIAIGAMRALKDAGLSVPEDISVMGFDDIVSASLIDTPLTTMRVHRVDIGKWAVKLLIDTIFNPHPNSVKIQTSGTLKVRSSTCQPSLLKREIPSVPAS